MIKLVTVYQETPRGGYNPVPGLVNTDHLVWGRVVQVAGHKLPQGETRGLLMLSMSSGDVVLCEAEPVDFLGFWIGEPLEDNEG